MQFAHSIKLAFGRPLLALAVVSSVGLAGVAMPAAAQAPEKAQKPAVAAKVDPLASETWHASAPSWPGTLKFDGKSKKVLLEPVGATPIEASYVVSDVKTLGKTVTGQLRMVDTSGRVSESSFTIANGKTLSISFAGGQSQETYVRMTAAEAEAEKARLLKAIQEGKTKMPGMVQ